jgi:predicted PurR-regulated permease PerM
MPETRVTPGTLYRVVLLAFALVVAALLINALATLIMAVMIVAIIALPLSAVAERLMRFGVPRVLGAVIGMLLLLGAFTGLGFLIAPAFSHEIHRFANSLPGIVDRLRHRLAGLLGSSPTKVGRQLQHFVNSYTQHPAKLLGPAESIGASVAAAIAALIIVLITALYTAINPRPLISGFLRMVPPRGRPQAEVVLTRLRIAYLGWLRGLVLGMVVLGGLTYLGLRLVGLGFAAFFAVFTALAMIIPYFGALASSIPPILYALTVSPGKAVVVAAIYVVAHQIESNIIQPQVVARTVDLHPAVVAVGVVAVDTLFGFVGLIVAVPILVTVRVLVEELWIRRLEERREEVLVTQAPAELATVRDSEQSARVAPRA